MAPLVFFRDCAHHGREIQIHIQVQIRVYSVYQSSNDASKFRKIKSIQIYIKTRHLINVTIPKTALPSQTGHSHSASVRHSTFHTEHQAVHESLEPELPLCLSVFSVSLCFALLPLLQLIPWIFIPFIQTGMSVCVNCIFGLILILFLVNWYRSSALFSTVILW